MTVFTWCSLVALERATREKLFFMYGVFEKARVKEEARDTIASWMRYGGCGWASGRILTTWATRALCCVLRIKAFRSLDQASGPRIFSC